MTYMYSCSYCMCALVSAIANVAQSYNKLVHVNRVSLKLANYATQLPFRTGALSIDMASGKGQQMGPLALETVLQDWVVSHAGRLWLTTEELTTIIDQAGFTKPQVTNYLLTFQTRNHPLRQKLTPGSTATVHSARPLTPSQSQGNQRGVDTPCPIPAVSAPSPTTIPQTPTKRKRHDFIFAIERIPFKENGLVNFEILGATAMKHFPPQTAGEFRCLYCDRSYKDAYLLSAHLLSHTGPFFICSVPNCRANVGEIRMTHGNIKYHMEEHMKRKDIENRLIYPPYKPDATDHWQRTPQEIQEHITQLMTQRAKIDTAEKDTLPGMEEKESNKRTNHWFKFIKQ
ncbi:Xylosidase/arabinosidase [Fusarium oxysporum f. sp. albedinis]|nr:Xylosidase/arabinosidase [Fusarium oxysporum f. sp. albedinis]